MSPSITEDLGATVIARWYTRLAGNRASRRNHWQTKIAYYDAVSGLLAARPAHPLTWKTVVGAVRPRGCRSTFYEVAGPRARHGMVAALLADGTVGSMEMVLQYQQPDPVEQLIDEAKIWSFWPYRQRFAERAVEPGTAPDLVPELLRRTLMTWAATHSGLAAANAYRPPACAVEDLTLLHRGRLAATRSQGRLTEVLRQVTPR